MKKRSFSFVIVYAFLLCGSLFAQEILNDNFLELMTIPGRVIKSTTLPDKLLIFNGLFEKDNTVYVDLEKIQIEGQKDSTYYVITNSAGSLDGRYIFFYYKSIDEYKNMMSVIMDLSAKAKSDLETNPSEIVTYYYTFDGTDTLRIYLDFGYIICEYYIAGKRALFISGYDKIRDFAEKTLSIYP